ncbi:MAG: hypothetical protein HKN84_12175 [Gammaproteobacteria bacterium]|nr:hypothetical protein [Gammaproteobacteria bacterium]
MTQRTPIMGPQRKSTDADRSKRRTVRQDDESLDLDISGGDGSGFDPYNSS